MRRVAILLVAFVAQLASSFLVHSRSNALTTKTSSPYLTQYSERSLVISMAVPKKRQSKMKTRQRKAKWFSKADAQAARALALGRSVLKGSATSFVYVDKKEEFDDDDDDDDDDADEIEEKEEEEEEADDNASSTA